MTQEQTQLVESASSLADKAAALSNDAISLAQEIVNFKTKQEAVPAPESIVEAGSQIVVNGVDPFIFAITVFVLACFVGYYVVWKVTPALHTPLMSVTNAVSSIIIIGAILALGVQLNDISEKFGTVAIFIASINIFGGFVVTHRMLAMFRNKG